MQGVTLRRIPAGQPGAGIAVVKLLYTADPTMTPEKLETLRCKYTSEARFRREMLVEFEALEGELLYPEFSRERNVRRAFDVSDPNYWTLWMALDPHPRTAHALVWEAFNKHDDRVVCGEFWPEFGTRYGPVDGVRWKTRDYAEAIQMFESDSQVKPSPFVWARGKRLKVFRRIMDTYGKGIGDEGWDEENYFDAYRRLGVELTKDAVVKGRPNEALNLNFDPALKGHDNLAKAADSIGRALAVRRDERDRPAPPKMTVFEECYETIDEFENVRFPKGKRKPGDDFGSDDAAGSDRDEKPITYQKHCLDGLHYIETARPHFVMPRRSGAKYEPLDKATNY